MAGQTRRKLTKQRMESIADWSLAQYLRSRSEDEVVALEDLCCEYAGVTQADGAYDPDAHITQKSKVAFRWRLPSAGPQVFEVEVLCRSAIERGVAFPPHWYFAIKSQDLQTQANAAAAEDPQTLAASSACCRVLGLPRRSPMPEESDMMAPGFAVLLSFGNTAVEFLLCAHEEIRWYFPGELVFLSFLMVFH